MGDGDAGAGLMGDGDGDVGLVGDGDVGLVGDGDEVAGRTFAKIMIIMRRIMAPIKIPPSPAFLALISRWKTYIIIKENYNG